MKRASLRASFFRKRARLALGRQKLSRCRILGVAITVVDLGSACALFVVDVYCFSWPILKLSWLCSKIPAKHQGTAPHREASLPTKGGHLSLPLRGEGGEKLPKQREGFVGLRRRWWVLSGNRREEGSKSDGSWILG